MYFRRRSVNPLDPRCSPISAEAGMLTRQLLMMSKAAPVNLYLAPAYAQTGTGLFTASGPDGGTHVSDGSAGASVYKAVEAVPGCTFELSYYAERIGPTAVIFRCGTSAIGPNYVNNNSIIQARQLWIHSFAFSSSGLLYVSYGYGSNGATLRCDSIRLRMTLNRPGVYCWGDSLTQGSGATGASAYYPAVLQGKYTPARYTFHKGVGGETSSQILARILAEAALTSGARKCTHVLWMGRNNFSAPSTVRSDIAAAVTAVGGDYRVCSILTSSADSAQSIADIQALNSSLAGIYGPRFIDLYAYLRARGDGSANDNADIAAGYTPRSLRSDAVHLNDAGYAHVAQCVFESLGLS